MRVYLRPKLLIVDEVGYMPLYPVAATPTWQQLPA
jgi:hypothetical protein